MTNPCSWRCKACKLNYWKHLISCQLGRFFEAWTGGLLLGAIIIISVSTTTLHLHRTWWTMIVHPRAMWHFYLIVHTSLPTGWIRLKRQTCKIYDHSTQHLEPSPYCVLLHLGANEQCCKNCTVNVQSPRRAGTLSITLSLTDRWPWKTVIEDITVTRRTSTIYVYIYIYILYVVSYYINVYICIYLYCPHMFPSMWTELLL